MASSRTIALWPVFVVNLDRAMSRMSQSEAILKDRGIPFHRFTACDGRSLSEADIVRLTGCREPRFQKRLLTAAEIACYASHVEIWRQVAASSAPGAIVLEDDFDLSADAAEVFSAISSAHPTWDMLKFFSDKPKALREAEDLPGGFKIGTPEKLPMSTIGYAITRAGAAGLYQVMMPVRYPLDNALKRWWEHGCCVKLIQPSVVVPREGNQLTSEIAQTRRENLEGNLFLRFIANTIYQLSFKCGAFLNRRERALSARWPNTRQTTNTAHIDEHSSQ